MVIVPAPGLRAASGLTVVVSGSTSDAHTWNLVFLQLLLSELGHRVTNLGPCPQVELVLEQCRRIRPDLIVISSVNGHGFHDGEQLIRKLRDCPALAATKAVIGGKLGISAANRAERVRQLADAGFDAVFDDAVPLTAFRAFVSALAIDAAK